MPHLKIDMPIGQTIGTALIQEVDILDEKAEERNDDLIERGYARNGEKRRFLRFYKSLILIPSLPK